MADRKAEIAALQKDWDTNPRWKGIKRGYSAADVVRLRGSFPIEYTLARRGAEKLMDLLHTEAYVNCLGALTGGQAMQQVKAGIKAIYLSGWQVAADNNGYSSMPAIPAHGKFTASQRTLRICWHVKHSQSLASIEKMKEELSKKYEEVKKRMKNSIIKCKIEYEI